MKLIHTIRSLVLSVALVAPAFAALPSWNSEFDALVPLNAAPGIAHGMSRETVEFTFGTPGTKLSDNVWVYWGFKSTGVPGGDAFNALIVGFTGDRVTLLRLCRSEPVKAFIAQQKTNAQKTSFATQ